MSPDWCQAFIRTNAGILLSGTLNLSEILIEIHITSFMKNAFQNIVWKIAAILSRSYCPHSSLNTMAANLRTRFSNAVWWMNNLMLWLKCHLSIFCRIQMAINQHSDTDEWFGIKYTFNWNSTGVFPTGPSGLNFGEISKIIKIHPHSAQKLPSSTKCQPFCSKGAAAKDRILSSVFCYWLLDLVHPKMENGPG